MTLPGEQAVVPCQTVHVGQPPGRDGGDYQSGGSLPVRKLFHRYSSFLLSVSGSNGRKAPPRKMGRESGPELTSLRNKAQRAQ